MEKPNKKILDLRIEAMATNIILIASILIIIGFAYSSLFGSSASYSPIPEQDSAPLMEAE